VKNKYDFIQEVLENKRLKPDQRERVLQLAAKEIGGEKSLDERISELEKIFKDNGRKEENLDIEMSVVDSATLIVEEKAPKQKQNQPKYKFPKGLKEFLFRFNQNEILRSACHDVDSDELLLINKYCHTSEYSFQRHSQIIYQEYLKHDKKYFAPAPVKALFRAYFTGKDFSGEKSVNWSADSIQISWNSPELADWVNKNKGIPPHLSEGLEEQLEVSSFEFKPFKSNMSGRRIQNFRDLIIHFKHLFHIRSDNSLIHLVRQMNEYKGWNEKIEFKWDDSRFPINIEMFTDVDKLLQAYNKILELAIESSKRLDISEKPKIQLTLTESDKGIEFAIHHFNSQYGKTLEQTLIRSFGKTYSQLIKMQINGYCELYLSADFGQDTYANINLWNGEDYEVEFINSFEGVEHILRFPK
jgi:hypothetical protein